MLTVAMPVRAAQSELVIHIDGTKLYHRPGCPSVKAGASVIAMTRAQAESRGHTAHRDCDPATASPPGAGGKPAAPPPTVYLNGTKYYHRKDCRRLEQAGKEVRGAALEQAGKSHWPCPDCRPPVRQRSNEPAVPGTGRRGR